MTKISTYIQHKDFDLNPDGYATIDEIHDAFRAILGKHFHVGTNWRDLKAYGTKVSYKNIASFLNDKKWGAAGKNVGKSIDADVGNNNHKLDAYDLNKFAHPGHYGFATSSGHHFVSMFCARLVGELIDYAAAKASYDVETKKLDNEKYKNKWWEIHKRGLTKDEFNDAVSQKIAIKRDRNIPYS